MGLLFLIKEAENLICSSSAKPVDKIIGLSLFDTNSIKG